MGPPPPPTRVHSDRGLPYALSARAANTLAFPFLSSAANARVIASESCSKIILAISAARSRFGRPPGLPLCPGFQGFRFSLRPATVPSLFSVVVWPSVPQIVPLTCRHYATPSEPRNSHI